MALAAWSILSMDEARDYLKPGDSSDDFIIEALTTAATLACERETTRKLVSRTYTAEIYSGHGSLALKLREYPVTSVTSVEFLTTEVPAAWTAQSLTDYPVTVHEPVKDVIYYRNNAFPCGLDNIRLTYIAGLTTTPEDLKSACRIVLMDLWKQRDKQLASVASQTMVGGQTITYHDKPIPPLAARLLEPYVRMAA